MKLAAFALTLIPGIAIASSWTSPGFPTFSTQETGRFTSHAALTKGTRALTLHIDQQCWQPSGAIKLNQMLSLKPCEGAPPQWRLFKDGDYTITVDTRSGTPTLLLSIKTEPERTAQLAYQCPVWDGSPLTLDVRQTFPEGTVVRDYYSGQTDTVQNGQITLQPADSHGLLLLERAETHAPAPFNWRNATVYFVLTDRFRNGDPTNDHSPHYLYHGYYTQDWTTLDANMGSEADLRALVDGAHQRGIRILFDVVMNHAGYATLADMQEYQFGALYLSGAERQKILGDRWTNWRPTTSTSATAPPGKNGGGKSGFVPILATTTVRDLTI